MFLILLAYVLTGAHGVLQFASYYQDHMVLQRGPQQAVVWGFAMIIGDNVTVQVSGHKSQTVRVRRDASHYGIWKVKLPAITDKGPFTVKATSSEGTVTIKDVLFGDVWLCSGQSNMEFRFSHVLNYTEELATALTFTDVRFMKVQRYRSPTPLKDFNHGGGIQTNWTQPTAGALKTFSAVCWFFGEYLYPDVNYPIGLVQATWGGTPIEAWSSPDALAKCPHHGYLEGYQSRLWNPMVNPLLGMTIYGAIWYQGEANVGFPRNYACQFPAMINDWRKKFHDASLGETSRNFPFGFVQLAGFRDNATLVGSFPGLRWAQTARRGKVPNEQLRNVFMAVAMDLSDFDSPLGSIHPRYKQDVSRRLRLGALDIAYNKTIQYQGPYPRVVLLDKTRRNVHIMYDHGPLLAKNIDGFEVCCSHNATCLLARDWISAPIVSYHASHLVISASGCGKRHAVSLRYAWRESPCDYKQCTIYGRNTSLPAPPYLLKSLEGS